MWSQWPAAVCRWMHAPEAGAQAHLHEEAEQLGDCARAVVLVALHPCLQTDSTPSASKAQCQTLGLQGSKAVTAGCVQRPAQQGCWSCIQRKLYLDHGRNGTAVIQHHLCAHMVYGRQQHAHDACEMRRSGC